MYSVIMRQLTSGGGGGGPPWKTRLRMGRRKAAVFPEPVWAQAMRSLLLRMMGMACFCTGVGLLYWASYTGREGRRMVTHSWTELKLREGTRTQHFPSIPFPSDLTFQVFTSIWQSCHTSYKLTVAKLPVSHREIV